MAAEGSQPPPAPEFEDEPSLACRVFGDRIALARRYVELLAGPGVQRGLIGPREAGRLWTRHVLNSAALAELTPTGVRVVDIGSGAGLPGIPLALVRPDLQVDLVEPLLRRSTFLAEVVAELGLDRCRVVRARAEDAVGEVGGANVVTARAVAPLGKLARWAAPLLREGGELLALKGSSAIDEVERDRSEVRRAGIEDLTVVRIGADLADAATVVVRGRRTARAPSRRRGH